MCLGELVLVPADVTSRYGENGRTGKSFTTIILGGNARGDVLPPLTIYAAKSVKKEWTEGGPDGSLYKSSSSGWINHDIFAEWFDEIFLTTTRPLPRPIRLVLDGHNCHFSVKVIEQAKENEIIMLFLPPNSTHGLQPLDLVTFG